MAKNTEDDALNLKNRKNGAAARERFSHIYCNGAVCETDTRGYPTPENRSRTEIVVDATDGFIPLWNKDVTLRWRFQERSMALFRRPEAAKNHIRALLAESILLWGDATPIRFTEVRDGWDFELVVRSREKCSPVGCTLASAFFPDTGRHELNIYPTLFNQDRQEQIETLAHEIGHVFGLRHFFADIRETRWRSEIFGDHSPFSIMNYGVDSRMTNSDRQDLKTLYSQVWAGTLTKINGTPIRLVRPFSSLRDQYLAGDLWAMR